MWKEKLLEDFKDELEDSRKYAEMSDEADMSGCHHTAIGLWEMARDEYSHARFLRRELVKMGLYSPGDHQELESKYKDLAMTFAK